MNEVTQLYPATPRQLGLKGLYLSEQLHQCNKGNRPLIYANFVSSLDGRIALKQDGAASSFMPEGLTNRNDFRLFLELQAQADCLVTHGGYLRELAANRLGNVLQVGTQEGAEDLSAWRKRQGLKAQPDIVIASASLEFPLPDGLVEQGQKILIATGSQAEPNRVRDWQSRGIEVIFAGDKHHVQGAPLEQQLAVRGYCSIYLVTGPQMLETMLRDRCLRRLYLTQRHRLLGGENFHSLLAGEALGEAGYLQLRTLYYDASAEDGCTQLFASYDL